ncbi:IclR family transcriptional regulator [Pokkaliibacter plantistimulans]|uniref:IclR family transcriptional regulator n=1 Tax=Proteobacteria bacterium 228 TaxID=2083153 RepID=A0A2S5KSN2_9PROT|nr:IclR family transcriptional regulator C-terminal domain-containing protein [Pokkaliibacter plantistimulans]PPC77665.1 IclR family transcriptional regulator [Pokkaliibacter plantistimulans]
MSKTPGTFDDGYESTLTEDSRDFVSALASGLEVILAFDQNNRQMTLSEVTARTGMNRAKARRFLLTLEALGYVRKNQRNFELTPKILSLGYAYLSSNNFHSVIQQYLENISQNLGESSSLGVLDGEDVVYVSRAAAKHRLMSITLSVGTHLPAIVTSMGRVLLAQKNDDQLDAFLEHIEPVRYTDKTITDKTILRQLIQQVRLQGYCIVDQELDSALRSLALPVFDNKGKLVGALNVSTNAARISIDTLTREFLPYLQARIKEMSQYLN